MSYSIDLQKEAVTFYAIELPSAWKNKMRDYKRENGRTWFTANDIEAPYSTWDPKTRKNYLLFRGPNAAAHAVAFTMQFKSEKSS